MRASLLFHALGFRGVLEGGSGVSYYLVVVERRENGSSHRGVN
jgi:hypothetical protein